LAANAVANEAFIGRHQALAGRMQDAPASENSEFPTMNKKNALAKGEKFLTLTPEELSRVVIYRHTEWTDGFQRQTSQARVDSIAEKAASGVRFAAPHVRRRDRLAGH